MTRATREIRRPGAKPTYIFVHGAWHGAWCWDVVAGMLAERGCVVVAVDLPGHGRDSSPIAEQSLQSYVQKVSGVLDQQADPVILVGHSMGGAIITQVAEYRPEKIAKLVYVAAFLLKDGQSCDGAEDGVKPTDWYKLGEMGLVNISADGRVSKPSEAFARAAFFEGIAEPECRAHLARLSPEAIAVQYTPVRLSGRFASVPRVYVKCLQDNALPLEFQEKMIQATPVERVYEMTTSHSPFLMDPQGLVNILWEEG